MDNNTREAKIRAILDRNGKAEFGANEQYNTDLAELIELKAEIETINMFREHMADERAHALALLADAGNYDAPLMPSDASDGAEEIQKQIKEGE